MADRTVTDVMDKMGLNRSGSATEQHRNRGWKGRPPRPQVTFPLSKLFQE
jgi:hypothetical protein